MTEADILALTYGDKCWVYRPQKTTLPSGESVFQKGLEGKAVYEDIPCALSSPSGGKLGKRNPPPALTPTSCSLSARRWRLSLGTR